MSENLAKGASIVSVMAADRDIGSNAKLTYTLREQDREHFYISSIEATNTGVLKVFKVINQFTVNKVAELAVVQCHSFYSVIHCAN